jgi:CheY-like chemotaxis protein
MGEVEIIDVNSMVTEVVELISRTLDKSIGIEFRKGKDLPMIEGDESQLYQVIMNCAVNAQHAMPNGGRLEIETSSEEILEVIEMPHFTIEPGRYVTLKVYDTGIGMGKDTLSRIFEPYFTTRGDQGGSGLGMSVVFGIVKSHRGYIDVRSQPGRGTVVAISLPVTEKKKTDTVERIDAVEGGTETILVIDDEQHILKMAQALLEGSGYIVRIASSGIEGLEKVRDVRPDLIILDLKMPEMDGNQVLQELMAIDRDLKVLISTGFIETGKKDELIKIGAKGLIEKPFTADDMKREIRKILEE